MLGLDLDFLFPPLITLTPLLFLRLIPLDMIFLEELLISLCEDEEWTKSFGRGWTFLLAQRGFFFLILSSSLEESDLSLFQEHAHTVIRVWVFWGTRGFIFWGWANKTCRKWDPITKVRYEIKSRSLQDLSSPQSFCLVCKTWWGRVPY